MKEIVTIQEEEIKVCMKAALVGRCQGVVRFQTHSRVITTVICRVALAK